MSIVSLSRSAAPLHLRTQQTSDSQHPNKTDRVVTSGTLSPAILCWSLMVTVLCLSMSHQWAGPQADPLRVQGHPHRWGMSQQGWGHPSSAVGTPASPSVGTSPCSHPPQHAAHTWTDGRREGEVSRQGCTHTAHLTPHFSMIQDGCSPLAGGQTTKLP